MNWLLMGSALACGVVLDHPDRDQQAIGREPAQPLHSGRRQHDRRRRGDARHHAHRQPAIPDDGYGEGTRPGYGWLAGGVLGAVYLTGNILLAPKLGAAALTGLVVTGSDPSFRSPVDNFRLVRLRAA